MSIADAQGWSLQLTFQRAAWIRLRYANAVFREEILDLAMLSPSQPTVQQLNDIARCCTEDWESHPTYLHFTPDICNSDDNSMISFMLIVSHLAYLNYHFLIQMLLVRQHHDPNTSSISVRSQILSTVLKLGHIRDTYVDLTAAARSEDGDIIRNLCVFISHMDAVERPRNGTPLTNHNLASDLGLSSPGAGRGAVSTTVRQPFLIVVYYLSPNNETSIEYRSYSSFPKSMVGVGGRSKACGQCRRRRVKCDEQKPHCLRCIKAKLECSGYPDVTIIQFDGRRRRRTSTPTSRNTLNSDRELSTEIVPRAVSSTPQIASTAGPSIEPRISLNYNDVFMEYTRSKLFRGLDSEDLVLPPNLDQGLVSKAFLALCTTFFGVEHKEQQLISRGFHQYGHALERVHGALGDPSRRASFDLLKSIAVMSLFEFLISDRQDGWLSHTVGLEKLYALRGPYSFKTLSELQLFENSRPSIIFSSLFLRRHTILSKPEWKVMPWITYPDKKTAMQRLVDLLADCPALFMEQDRIASESPGTPDQTGDLIELLRKVIRLLDDLLQWNEQWELENPDYCYDVPAPASTPLIASMYDGDSYVPAWSTVLEYKSMYHANTVIVYNGTLVLLLNLAQSVMQMKSIPTMHQTPHIIDMKKIYNAGITICRSVEYHLQSMRQGAGSFFLLFPLRMAYVSVGRTEPTIGTWIQDVLKQIQDGKSGRWATAKYLLDLQPLSRNSASRIVIT
ncbi:conserved hypothetical protein [Talaromyces stipitatus ATCC 10500]|uniref:Zn(2)-C6 fungal-type domain-containing protein n=1 Tax=Talaromyces stipitatus (strain ATCC 10500 / CBS 375.48 / QM 6759 / NRRL 1006) TaxID=441959 RepID=B8MJU0_TALSN|nr:uncharacterized protein TSTA_042320 [Talaromyces stipitatus ATCC 10500]EED14757.1 conserved hypothetical protein [Talaromyces stipitatus ATCC 10500]